MRVKIIASAGLSAALMLVSCTVLADTPGADWMPREKAIASLSHQGYANAYLKADDGHWEGEATKGGRIYEIHVDPHSGKLTKQEPKD